MVSFMLQVYAGTASYVRIRHGYQEFREIRIQLLGILQSNDETNIWSKAYKLWCLGRHSSKIYSGPDEQQQWRLRSCRCQTSRKLCRRLGDLGPMINSP